MLHQSGRLKLVSACGLWDTDIMVAATENSLRTGRGSSIQDVVGTASWTISASISRFGARRRGSDHLHCMANGAISPTALERKELLMRHGASSYLGSSSAAPMATCSYGALLLAIAC